METWFAVRRRIITQKPEKAIQEKRGQQREANISSRGVHAHMHPLFVSTTGSFPYDSISLTISFSLSF
jgi:hypothetical protein